MSAITPNLDRFLRAVYRRWVAVRVAESVGVAVLAGCAVVLLVLPVLLWRGEPALPVVLTVTTVAVLAGLIAGIVRRPNLLSAAGEADRQLQLADLLSTALLTRTRTTTDPWTMTVLATADARCGVLAPNAVILNRLGGRAWGGIGLAAALVWTLGLMSADPQPPAAVAATAGGDRLLARDDAASTPSHSSPRTVRDAPQRARDPHRPVEAGVEREAGSAVAAGGATDQGSPTASASESGGAGLATSSRESSASRPPLAGLANQSSQSSTTGERSGGGGTSTVTADEEDDAAAHSTVASRHSAAATPPWRTSSWPAAREQALAAVRDRRVPDAYRDLVGAYFDDPATTEPHDAAR